MNKTLGQRIRELREQHDLSLAELGKLIRGKTAAFLSDIELGRRFPSEGVLNDIAGALKTTIEDLKSYDNRPPVKDMKDLIATNPQFGVMFRKMVEKSVSKDVSPEQVLKFLNRQTEKKKDT